MIELTESEVGLIINTMNEENESYPARNLNYLMLQMTYKF